MTATTTPARDWSLHSGERQTAPTWAAIRADHRARYAWAADMIGFSTKRYVLDVFCGTGYGTQYLAEMTGAKVIGLDGSSESIAFARKHFDHPRVSCETLIYGPGAPLALAPFDAVVCFESLEHIEDDRAFARDLAEEVAPGGRLILSVPNERVIPHATFRNPFHVRHYTREQVITAFCDELGLTLDAWAGQSLDGTLRAQTEDRTLVFAFHRGEEASHA